MKKELILIMIITLLALVCASTFQDKIEADFNSGTYNNTEFNNTGVMLKYWSSSDQELPNNKATDGYFDMNGNVLLMHMNETSGLIEDFSGEGNNGTQSGGLTYNAEGKLNTALSFDGLDDYVDVGGKVNLNFTEDLTLLAWIYPIEATISGIVGKWIEKEGFSPTG